MANFLKHEPCPRCLSRDNLGVYDDGSKWCFGCHYYLPPRHAPLSSPRPVKELLEACKPLPDDADFNFTPKCREWLDHFQTDYSDLAKFNVLCSPKREQVLFTWNDGSENVIAWQARNVNPSASRRYFTTGDITNLLPIYRNSGTREFAGTLVLVEDCLSAIKISPLSDSMPCLGSGVPPVKLKRVAELYSRLIIWLDSNMFPNAVKLAEQARLLGVEATACYTDLDPKCYSRHDIKNILQKVLDKS